MVMAERPEVSTASPPIAAVDTMGLGQQMVNALVRVPFRKPWDGPSNLIHNLGQNVTREVVRTFMGYSSSIPIDEYRSIESMLDSLCKVVMKPVVAIEGVESFDDVVGGVPGIWYRPKGIESIGRILYLHGGGYVGTSPNMYAFFTARLAAATQCEIFVADYRLAPEFPFPAGLDDAVAVLESLIADGHDPLKLFVAGDSGGGGLACSLMFRHEAEHLPDLGGLLLFSPEVDLRLDQPSVTDNAATDILPWNIPTAAYLHGHAAAEAVVSALDQDLESWPSVYLTWGHDEMFRDSIRQMSENLESADVHHVSSEAAGMFHVYPILMPWAMASREAFAEAGEFVRVQVTEASDSGPRRGRPGVRATTERATTAKPAATRKRAATGSAS